MSLIGEALKKAHLEALRQDGSSAGLAHTPGVAQYRQRQPGGRTGWPTALVASNVVLALIVATVMIWQWTDRTGPAPAVTPQSVAELPTVDTPPLPVPETRNTAPTVDKSADVSRTDSSEPRTETVEERISRPEPLVAAAAPAPVKSSPPPSPRSIDGLVAGQTYMGSIPVPGGTDLTLNGMSVSGGVGVALINSRMVREGDRIGPFAVGSIGDRRVELGYKGITIYLKMR